MGRINKPCILETFLRFLQLFLFRSSVDLFNKATIGRCTNEKRFFFLMKFFFEAGGKVE